MKQFDETHMLFVFINGKSQCNLTVFAANETLNIANKRIIYCLIASHMDVLLKQNDDESFISIYTLPKVH